MAGILVAVSGLNAQPPAGQACREASAAAMAPLKVETACRMTENEVSAIAKKWVDTRIGICHEDPSFFRDAAAETARIRGIRDRLCETQKGGPDILPQFEAALYAMTDARRLDPCAYDPKRDYSAVVNDPQYQTFNSPAAYNNGITFRRFELYASRADEASRACFLELIKAKLKGAEWKPPKPLTLVDTPGAVSSSQPRAAIPARSPGLTGEARSPNSAPVAAAPEPRRDARPTASGVAQSAYSGPRSGSLTYSGPPVPQNGEIVFRGLPAGQLRLTYDSRNWSHRLVTDPAGAQNLVLISKKSGLQRQVKVEWSLDAENRK